MAVHAELVRRWFSASRRVKTRNRKLKLLTDDYAQNHAALRLDYHGPYGCGRSSRICCLDGFESARRRAGEQDGCEQDREREAGGLWRVQRATCSSRGL